MVELPPNLSRLEMAKVIADSLGWNEEGRQIFASTYAQLQWALFNKDIIGLFTKKFKWNKDEAEAFSVNSTSYLDPRLDFLGSVYEAGTYEISPSATGVEISNLLADKVKDAGGENLEKYISNKVPDAEAAKVNQFVEKQMELLPDLVPIPARDMFVERTATTTLLRFSTIYYNMGDGPVELRADPKNIELRKDVERDVMQRIYRSDGKYREKLVGTFLWHQAHLHYHYADFIVYDLEAVDAPGAPDLSGVKVKSTFCLRDVSRVEMQLDNRPPDAVYKICGKRLQGVSVGWADTYFNTYPDQALNISELPSGTYRLSFKVNPSEYIDEKNYANNLATSLFKYDAKTGKIKVLEESPQNAPEVKHIYKDPVNE